jgi:hypothetical protein
MSGAFWLAFQHTVAGAQVSEAPPVDEVTKAIYTLFNPGRNLRDEAGTATRDVILRVAPGKGEPLGLEEFPAETTELNHLGSKTCAADLVVIGRLKSRVSSFSNDGSAIFTVYSMSAEEILRQSARSHAASSTTISVSRLGGSVKVNDHSATLIEAGVDRLELGTSYLFFLKFIPRSSNYQAFSSSILNVESQTVTSIYGHKQLAASLDQ